MKQELFNYLDEDTSLNQLLELLKYKDMKFIDSQQKQVDLMMHRLFPVGDH